MFSDSCTPLTMQPWPQPCLLLQKGKLKQREHVAFSYGRSYKNLWWPQRFLVCV